MATSARTSLDFDRLPVDDGVSSSRSERLGMANALSLAAPHIRGPLLLSACDNLTPTRTYRRTAEPCIGSKRRRRTLSLMEIDPVAGQPDGHRGLGGWPRQRHCGETDAGGSAVEYIQLAAVCVLRAASSNICRSIKPSPRGEYELQDAIQMLIDDTDRVTGVFTQHTTATDQRRRPAGPEPALPERRAVTCRSLRRVRWAGTRI